MKNLYYALVVLFLTLAGTLEAANGERTIRLVSLDDVVLLAENNISDETILAFLSHREPNFTLDASTLVRLRDAGVSEAVVIYLLDMQEAPDTPELLAFDPAVDIPSAGIPELDEPASYPDYYYGSNGIGVSSYPPAYSDYRYSGAGFGSFGLSTSFYSGGHGAGYGTGYGIGYIGGGLNDHGNNLSHNPIINGVNGHQGGSGLRNNHTGGANLIHDSRGSGAHSRNRGRGHSGGISRGHSGGISGGHSSGHYSSHGRGH